MNRYTLPLLLGALSAFLTVSSTSGLANDAVPVDWSQATVEGGDRAPLRIELGDQQNSAQMILEHRKAWNSVRIPVAPDLEKTNLLKFRASFSSSDPKLQNFSLSLYDSQGRLYGTTLSRQSTRKGEEMLFVWDIQNEPNIDKGTDFKDLKNLVLKFNFGAIPENEELIITIKDMEFVAGPSVVSGDPVRFEKWKHDMANYRPDDSDSSRFLDPPLTGRVENPVALVKNHQPLASIVVAAEAGEPEKNAARELQLWIRRITKAELPIIHEVGETEGNLLFLGESFAKELYSDDLKALSGSDGFAIRTKGHRVHIFGADPKGKGTLNGVFAFIENNSNLIWARPHPDFGTVYSESADFAAVWADALERPPTKYRGWLPNLGGGTDFALWANRNRNNYVGGQAAGQLAWGDRVEFGGGHNLQSFIPKEDERYYPVIDGKKPQKLSIWKHQICLSVPDLVSTYAANVVKYIQEKGPVGLDVFNIKIEDNHGVCECEKCLAPLTLPDGTVVKNDNPAFRSTQFFHFLNEVTKKINETFPNLQIQTYAYFYTAVPPLIAVDKNIYVLFCPYVRPDHRNPMYAPINHVWWERLTAWSKMTPNIVIREYYGIFNEGRPLGEVVAADVRADLELGVRSFSAEINPDFSRVWSDGTLRGGEAEFDLSAMDFWMINRVYWNPEENLEDLRKYYIRRTFREAAPMMDKFFGLVRQGWYENLRPPSTWGNSANMWKQTIVSKGLLDEMQALLDQALAAAKNPSSQIMVAKIRDRFLGEVGRSQEPLEIIDPSHPTPSQFLHHGWRSVGRGNTAYSTHLIKDGKSVPAVRLISIERKKGKPNFTTLFSPNVAGKTFRFTVTFVQGAPSLDALPLLSVSDKDGEEVAPVESYQASKVDADTWEFSWTPKGENTKGKPLDLEKITRLQFISQGTAEEIQEFILTNLDVH